METKNEEKKVVSLCVSGGGSKGSFAGGIVECLIKEKQKDWSMFFGTSTGSLIIPLASLKETDRLKIAYTEITQKSIFKINPFTKKGNINILNAIWRIIRGKTSLGDASNLKKRILTMFTKEDFYKTKKEFKKLYVCITNYTKGIVEFKSNFSETYEDYVDYTLASTSVPLAFDMVNKYNNYYLDGGVMDHVPIQKAIDMGSDEIDIIILRPEKYEEEKWKGKNILDVLLRTTDLMLKEISLDDVMISKLIANTKNVKLNLYYTPYNLTDNSLVFNKEQMIKWWKEGYDYAKNVGETKTLILKATKKSKK